MRSPSLSGRGTTFSLEPFLCCPPGPIVAPGWGMGCASSRGHRPGGCRDRARAAGASAPPFSALLPGSDSEMGQERQAEDRAISHSHSETGHSFPLPQTGWEQCCWLSLAPVLPWRTLDKSHPCFLPQSLVCKMDTNTSQGCCET